MTAGRVVVLAAAAALASGCAGARTRQEVARLQSQIGLLDERLTQLERAAVERTFSAEPPTTPTVRAPTVQVVPAPPVAPAAPAAKPGTRQIQQALKNAGFYQGAVDGKMGPVTRDAIREFQRAHGLAVDGQVGQKTWAKLAPFVDLSADSDELSAADILK
jgi:peptidoglycan hydrolase-like protein with peptidoglycan-binding domain